MNLFNEFIKELKEEDLLEDSKHFVELPDTQINDSADSENFFEDDLNDSQTIFVEENISENSFGAELENERFVEEKIIEEYSRNDENLEETAQVDAEPGEISEIIAESAAGFFVDENSTTNSFGEAAESFTEDEKAEALHEDSAVDERIFVENTNDFAIIEEQGQNDAPMNESGYFRKRAMDEVSFLQMVENIFSGIERQQMKIVPKPYNELPVKKALHNFLQLSDDVDAPEHAQSEFQLLQETESWYSALSHRDKHISVANLRLYCETTRPPLSSPALVSLARFYRNLPYSEAARNKFDLIVTRLFSKDIKNDKREMLFHRDELIEHFKGLYKEWESISIYSSDEDDSEILLTAIKFEEFTTEAEEAESFDQLIETDFFNRLRVFKKSVNENFFAPLLSATAVETNIRIGNRYIELLEKERGKENASIIEEKYGFLHDQTISDATSKTLQLVELLKEKKVEKQDKPESKISDKKLEAVETDKQKAAPVQNEPIKTKKFQDSMFSGFFSANKWLVLATILSIVVSFGLYLWAGQVSGEKANNEDVKVINLENSSLNNYLQTARITKDTFYAVTSPAWDSIAPEKKKELLDKIMSISGDKGFKSVHLLNKQGKTVGYASADKAEVVKP